MKRNDYINVQAPMISDLNLSGKNELLIFALIHGYTKDGKSTCRVSLKNMSEWLKTSRSAVVRTLNDLEDAGYINRHEYYEGKVKCVEYTTNYEDLLRRSEAGEYISLESAKKARGLKMRPAVEGAVLRGSQNETGLKMITRGSQNDNETGLKIRPNNNIIINYNNFYCADPAQQEEEKKIFYQTFLLRNAADPAAEVEKFIAYNDSLQWRNEKGRVYDTPEARASLAKLWQFKTEGQWARQDYLNALIALVSAARKENIEGVEALLDQKVRLVWNGSNQHWDWVITPDARRWVEAHAQMVHEHIDPVLRGARATFSMVNN